MRRELERRLSREFGGSWFPATGLEVPQFVQWYGLGVIWNRLQSRGQFGQLSSVTNHYNYNRRDVPDEDRYEVRMDNSTTVLSAREPGDRSAQLRAILEELQDDPQLGQDRAALEQLDDGVERELDALRERLQEYAVRASELRILGGKCDLCP